MDMQAEIRFTIESLKGSSKKVITKIIDETSCPDRNLGDEFISFREHSTVTVELFSHNPDVVMEIESYSSDEVVAVKPGEGITISSGKDEDDMLVPGSYYIAIIMDNKRYEGLFTVESSSMSWDGVVNMRKYLESLLQGLSYDLQSKRRERLGEQDLHNVFLDGIFSFINENHNMVVNHINSIISSPITNIKKTYRELPYSRRPDYKSEKWLSKKGSAVNGNHLLPEIVYEKHTTLDRDNAENRYLRRMIHDISILLCSLEGRFEAVHKNIEHSMQNKHQESIKVKEGYENLLNNFRVSERYKIQKKRKVDQLKEAVKELEERDKLLYNAINSIKKFRAMLSHSEFQTWLQDIKGYEKTYRPSLIMLKDSRYLELYNFYVNLKAMEKNDRIDTNIKFSHKRTSKLFEYFTVAMVINILQSEGFEWDGGWIADRKISYTGELPDGTVMHFSKASIECHVVYDMEVESSESLGFVRNNARYNRPDIRVEFYEDGELKSALIIEVKCRKSKYLFSEDGDTSVIEHLKDYYNLGYNSTAQSKIERGRINRVIVVYPKQPQIIKYHGDYDFSFVQIEPGQVIDETYGYNALKKEIEDFAK